MSSNKADKCCSDIKKYHSDQPIIIAPDIKYKPVITNCIKGIYVIKIQKI